MSSCVKKPAEKEITNSVLVTFNLRCLWKYWSRDIGSRQVDIGDLAQIRI